MQYEMDTSGWSHVSLMDAGLGVAAGFAVPIVAETVMAKISNLPPWMGSYRPQLAAAVGLAASVPLYFWRGFGPAVIGGMMSIAYGLADLISDYLGDSSATAGIRASRAMGVISASPRRRLSGGNRLSGIRAQSPQFQGTSF